MEKFTTLSSGEMKRSPSPAVIPTAIKDACFRCKKAVYPTDKVGPLKDGMYFHHGCFKCYICGTRLQLKTYQNNRSDTLDQEVYCISHVPLANPHDPVPHRSNLANGIKENGALLVNGHSSLNNHHSDVGDMKIAHAMRATALQKPYPKIIHPGAKYVLDYDTQTRLELIHRKQEDDLYEQFSQQREEEEKRFTEESKEEWERALNELSGRYERQGKFRDNKSRDELIKHLTLKRDKRRESMVQQWRERERTLTAELVDQQSKEMMDLFRQARQEIKYTEQSGQNGYDGSQHSRSSPGDSPSTTYPSTPPPPFPPIGRKRDMFQDNSIFEIIDQTAISVAQSEQQTFTDLVRALTQNCQSDVEKARAIYRWITVKNLNLMEFDHQLDPNTPMGLLRGIKFGTESYHVLFKRLCSYAGLHCVVIKGYSKSAGYQPGMRFDDGRFRNTWNCVFLDSSWRFVQCNWGARHLVNAKDVPYSGGSVQAGRGRTENLRYEYDDHYFMTDPEEFIYEFFPQNPEWQLLKRPIALRDFEELPFVRSLFFRYGLGFADPKLRAVIFADKTGAATVAVTMSPEALCSLIFHYNLRFYHNEETELNGVSLKRFVMQSVVGQTVVFRVHTPCRSEFLLDVFANALAPGDYVTGQPMKFKSVCKFKVICEHLTVIMVPLPECASGEWGPAKAYRLFGLIPITHEDAIINSGRELEIRFKMQRPLAEFVTNLRNNGHDDRRLEKCISHFIRADQVVIRVNFPDEGQYGLDIYTRDRSSSATPQVAKGGEKQLLTHCCKYLINSRLK